MSDQLALYFDQPQPELPGEYLTFDDPDLTTTFDLAPNSEV